MFDLVSPYPILLKIAGLVEDCGLSTKVVDMSAEPPDCMLVEPTKGAKRQQEQDASGPASPSKMRGGADEAS